MRIVQLEIENFRGVRQGRIVLPEHCVLLGRNDVGKTTIAEGLALLAGKERLTKPLCDWDFHGGSPTPASRLTLIATISGFGDGVTQDTTDFPQWFHGERSARPVWWIEETAELSTAIDPPANGRLAAQVAVTGRYDEEASEFDTIRYFYDGPTDPFIEDHRRVPVDRLRDLGIFLLPSGREWDRVLSFGSSSFLKMLREYGGVPGSAVEDLKGELRTPTTRIEDAAGLTLLCHLRGREMGAAALY
jgi:putative ATP-dependent endonuclease of OLD family